MSSRFYAITGIQTGRGPAPGQVPLRQQIDAWSSDPKNKPQVDLFLLGLKYFQEIDVQDKLSYYQVVGIHGLPSIPWDENATSRVRGAGYCTHNSTLFLPWHRPYLALFEQRLYECILEVIKQYPQSEQENLRAVAGTWRLPYWDWAIENDVPELLKSPTVQVRGPKGNTSIDNPLYKFTIPKRYPDFGHLPGRLSIPSADRIPYGICKSTLRWPPNYRSGNQQIEAIWRNGVENNDAVVRAMTTSSHGSYKELVYRSFDLKTWIDFATSLAQDQGASGMSLEGIHNNIHVDTGGEEGHMCHVPVAAFDPIFWLHHCNVDRLFAIWQAVNPQSWFDDPDEQSPESDGNFYLSPGEVPTPNTVLRPFHKDTNGTLYTSNDIRDFTRLGYAYPEVQRWKFRDDASYIASIKTTINNLYATTRRFLVQRPQLQIPSAPHPATPQPAAPQPAAPHPAAPHPAAPQPRAQQPIPAAAVTSAVAGSPHHEQPLVFPDYVATVIYSRFDLGGLPYLIYVFIGPESETIKTPPSTWRSSKYLVGKIYTFSTIPENEATGQEGCSKCKDQQEANVLSVGQIPLTRRLAEAVEDAGIPIDSLKRDAVLAFLKENLHWAVTGPGGRIVPLSELANLKVFVARGTAEHFTRDEKLSHFRNLTRLDF